MARPSARWTGTVVFSQLDELEIQGGFYSSTGNVKPLGFVQIHSACSSRVEIADSEEKPKQAQKGAKKPKEAGEEPVQTTRTINCPSCKKPIANHELGQAVETRMGLIKVSDTERAALKPEKQKSLQAELVNNVDLYVYMVGTGRRFWFLPKAVSVDDYYMLHEVLSVSGTAGLLKDVLIDKKAYVLTIRPLITPEGVFGERRKVLAVDEFMITDTLKSPQEFQLLPAEEPNMDAEQVGRLSVMALKETRELTLIDCLNPERRRFNELVQRKAAEGAV